MFCEKCGSEIPEGARFCQKCGYPANTDTVSNAEGKENLSPYSDKDSDNTSSKRKKSKRKRHVFLIIVCLLLTGCMGFLILKYYFNVGIRIPKDVEISETTDSESDNTVEPGTVYELKAEAVKLDEETGVHYVNDIILVFFKDSATDEDVDSVVKYLSGSVVGEIPAIKQYQIRIAAHSYDELLEICDKVSEFEYVERASIDIAMQLYENVIPNDPPPKK